MKQIFWPKMIALNDVIALDEKTAHHIFDVLRTSPKETLRIIDKSQKVFLGHVTNKPYVEIVEISESQSTPQLEITLCAALIKADKFEWMLQKAAELGASRIVPFVSANGVIQIDDKKIERKMARWESILEGACRQSNRTNLVKLEKPCHISNLKEYKSDINVCAWEKQDQSHPLCLALENLDSDHSSISFVIGPEGGFTLAEAQKLEKEGFMPCSFGPRILRAETAACYGLACAEYAWSQANYREERKESHFEVF